MEQECVWQCKTRLGPKKKKKLLFRVESEALLNGSNTRVRQLKSKINELLDREA